MYRVFFLFDKIRHYILLTLWLPRARYLVLKIWPFYSHGSWGGAPRPMLLCVTLCSLINSDMSKNSGNPGSQRVKRKTLTYFYLKTAEDIRKITRIKCYIFNIFNIYMKSCYSLTVKAVTIQIVISVQNSCFLLDVYNTHSKRCKKERERKISWWFWWQKKREISSKLCIFISILTMMTTTMINFDSQIVFMINLSDKKLIKQNQFKLIFL